MTVKAPARILDWEQVIGWRLRRHHLDERAPASELLPVVAEIAGLHAQVMSSAELTAWARLDGLERGALAGALWRDRTLVKTWAMRGTLHLLPAGEFPLWQAALSTRRGYELGSWQRAFGLTLEQIDELLVAVEQSLNGKVLPREALATEVASRTGSPELGDRLRSGWGAMLKPAAFRGKLCFGPSEGQRVCFTRPDQWVAGWRQEDPDAALLETARRYIRAAGVVTREEYARWWGMQPPQGGRVLRALGDELVRVEVGGAPAWALAADADGIAGSAPASSVRLLPAFDQYVVTATRHAETLMPGPFKDRVYRAQGWLSPVLLAGGRVLGTWRQEARGKRLAVTIEPFTKLPATVRRQAAAEAERLAAWTATPLDLTWSAP